MNELKHVNDGKYMIFAFDDYYPSGGMYDYQFSFDAWEDFIKRIDNIEQFNNYQVVNKETNVELFKSLEKLLMWVEGLGK